MPLNAFYATARASFAVGEIDWAGDTIKARFIDANHYTPTYDSQVPQNVTGAQFLSDISGSAFVGPAIGLSGKSNLVGALSAASPLTIPAFSGSLVTYLLIYQDTGNPATSRLIFLLGNASGLPLLPNSTAVDIYWDVGQFQIGQL